MDNRTQARELLQFAAYVRDAPEALSQPPEELAARFGLPESMVREALAVVTRRPKGARGYFRSALEALGRTWTRLSDSSRRAPYHAAIYAGLGWGVTQWIITALRLQGSPGGRFAFVGIGLVLSAGVAFLAGRARLALPLTASVAAPALALVFAALAYRGAAPNLAIDFAISWGLSVINTVIVFAPVTFAAALAGAYRHFRADQADEGRQDRLALLRRVFALREMLAEAAETGPQADRAASADLGRLEGLRRGWVIGSIAAGVLYGALTVAQAYAWTPAEVTPWAIAYKWVFTVAYAVLVVGCGYFGGTWSKGLAAGALVVVFSGLVQLWPAPGLGPGFIARTYAQPGELAMELVRIAGAGLAGLCAMIEERERRRRRIAASDQTALLAEILRIQDLLQSSLSQACVMAVDCAGSTAMKRDADPLEVEYSFREFHRFVERTVVAAGGTIQSTAGDSAIVQFQSASLAYLAAADIQTAVHAFNEEYNRLASPFRLRIGVHVGWVHGGLADVQFSDVIDVASHIQRYAPVGGIAFSEDATEELRDVVFVPADVEVAGHAVFWAREFAGPDLGLLATQFGLR